MTKITSLVERKFSDSKFACDSQKSRNFTPDWVRQGRYIPSQSEPCLDSITAYPSVTEKHHKQKSKLTRKSDYKANESVTCGSERWIETNFDFSRLDYSEFQRIPYNRKPLHSGNSLSKKKDVSLKENLFLKKYFEHSPEERIKLSKRFASYVKSLEDVLFILKCGNDRKIKEGFDSAVALVAECEASLLIQAIDNVHKLFINEAEKAQKYEHDWDILILGVACANSLGDQQKLQLFSSLFVENLSRTTKASLIDAIGMLSEEIDSQLIKIHLEHFVSENEMDEYIRDYAKEAIKDLS